MTILTLNCFGVPIVAPRATRRMRRIAEEVIKLKPDVICLQEVFLEWHKRLLIRTLGKRWPYYFAPREGVLGTGAGLCFFSKYPIAQASFVPFSSSGSWLNLTLVDKLVEKGFMKLLVDGPSGPFYVMNTHLTCNYHGNFKSATRILTYQSIQLKELSTNMRDTDEETPCFVVGDLNVPPSSHLLQDFLVSTGSTDLTSSSSQPSIRGNYYHLPFLFQDIVQPHKLDYILVRSTIPVTSSWQYVLDDDSFSDHRGILLKAEW